MNVTNLSTITTLIDLSISEDLMHGDITSELLIPPGNKATAYIITKQECVLSGQSVAQLVCSRIDNTLKYNPLVSDGMHLQANTEIAHVTGSVRSILAAERLVLNFLQKLSGISTFTNYAVLNFTDAEFHIIDTRKTTPGWRLLEKYAVRMGGGKNHRMSLGDGILIKDNHIKAVGGIKAAVKKAILSRPHLLKIEIEVTSISEAEEAVNSGAECLLLDNMPIHDIQEIIGRFGNKVLLEISGNITPESLPLYKDLKVNMISMGALTHSAPAIDISLYIR